jgi:mono/diheme cytochrome c family protein
MMWKVRNTPRLRAALTWSCLTFAVGVVRAAAAPGHSEGWQIPDGAETERNPVQINAAVIASGQRLYRSQCQRCHGVDGTGNGPDADPDHAPGNLTDAGRALRNPDGVMFYKIWNGRAKPKMPAMKSEMAPLEVWTVIHYVKTLRRGDMPTSR